MDISIYERDRETSRQITSEVLAAIEFETSLQISINSSGQSPVSPQASRGSFVDPGSGLRVGVLRYGDKYGSGRRYGR